MREETLPAAGLSPTQLADRLGVSGRGINDLLRERRSVTPDLAHRLARVFNTTPEFWLRLQEAVDIWDQIFESVIIRIAVQMSDLTLTCLVPGIQEYTQTTTSQGCDEHPILYVCWE